MLSLRSLWYWRSAWRETVTWLQATRSVVRGRLGKIVMNYLEYERSASKPLEKLEGEFASLKIHGA